VRSAAQAPISHKRIFRVLPIFRTHFSHVISQITFRTFAFRRLPLPQNYRSFALHNRCATDAYQSQASRGPLKNEKNEKWFIGYSSSMLDCTSNKTLKQEHTIQNYNTPVTGLPENRKTPQDAAKCRKTPQTVAKRRQTPQTRWKLLKGIRHNDSEFLKCAS